MAGFGSSAATRARRHPNRRRWWVRELAAAGVPWQRLPDGYEKRMAYYKSPEWGVVWEAVWHRCGGLCEVCRHRKMRQCHHLHYRHLYHELEGSNLRSVKGICFGCHADEHGKLRGVSAALVQAGHVALIIGAAMLLLWLLEFVRP